MVSIWNKSFLRHLPFTQFHLHFTNLQEKPLEDELATFYSDIASLDQSTSATSETKTQPTNDTTNEKVADAPVDGNSDTADEKKKKKRKKPKQLEPWRSGNLETWINKWQKAQKELDG